MYIYKALITQNTQYKLHIVNYNICSINIKLPTKITSLGLQDTTTKAYPAPTHHFGGKLVWVDGGQQWKQILALAALDQLLSSCRFILCSPHLVNRFCFFLFLSISSRFLIHCGIFSVIHPFQILKLFKSKSPRLALQSRYYEPLPEFFSAEIVGFTLILNIFACQEF